VCLNTWIPSSTSHNFEIAHAACRDGEHSIFFGQESTLRKFAGKDSTLDHAESLNVRSLFKLWWKF
jgi:hypothetical protein